jgi:hypothetical protein
MPTPAEVEWVDGSMSCGRLGNGKENRARLGSKTQSEDSGQIGVVIQLIEIL